MLIYAYIISYISIFFIWI